jgi:hypothetical protein
MTVPESVRRALAGAHEEALRVGDSPLRADRLADRLAPISKDLEGSEAPEDTCARINASLADAERVLRRDDDGREAARHLQAAIRLAGRPTPRTPSPFGED